MNILSLTEERLIQLKGSIKTNHEAFETLKNTAEADIWLEKVKIF